MTERPIIFSAPMVRAILDGRKTQTRRVFKLPRGCSWYEGHGGEAAGMIQDDTGPAWWHVEEQGCPYGAPGNRLWVRETWMPDAPRDGTWPDTSFYGCKGSPLSMIPDAYRKPEHCLFRSTWSGHELIGWKPSIHMPRWASRITLEITDVRVERLHDISEADAIAEAAPKHFLSPRDNFCALWQQINGDGSWDANPWVWCISFRRITP